MYPDACLYRLAERGPAGSQWHYKQFLPEVAGRTLPFARVSESVVRIDKFTKTTVSIFSSRAHMFKKVVSNCKVQRAAGEGVGKVAVRWPWSSPYSTSLRLSHLVLSLLALPKEFQNSLWIASILNKNYVASHIPINRLCFFILQHSGLDLCLGG